MNQKSLKMEKLLYGNISRNDTHTSKNTGAVRSVMFPVQIMTKKTSQGTLRNERSTTSLGATVGQK